MQFSDSIKCGQDILVIFNASIGNGLDNCIDMGPPLSFKLAGYFLFGFYVPDSPF